MSYEIAKLIEKGSTLADQRRLLPGVQALDEARQLSQILSYRAWASYALGVVQWTLLGNGLRARCEFLSCIGEFEIYGYGDNPNFKVVHANAVENAMLCALSFEEFESLAGKLNVLAPGTPILAGLVPRVRETREGGDSWLTQMLSIARNYYDRNDPRIDAGRYGEAKSTYHLILTHRHELRVSRELWRMTIYEYCALSNRMAADCLMARGGDKDPNSPEEFLPILTEAIPLADEYLRLNSGDHILKENREIMMEMVDGLRCRWTSLEKGIVPSLEKGIVLTDKSIRLSLHVKTYRNKRYGFEIEIPNDWKVRGIISGLAENPQFDGPGGASLKLAIGPVWIPPLSRPDPTAEEQQANLSRIVHKNGHAVLNVGIILVDGKTHATIVSEVPIKHYNRIINLKSYSIIFDGVEYLATADIAKFPEESYDIIIKSFRLTK
jgi:hypothetical protein